MKCVQIKALLRRGVCAGMDGNCVKIIMICKKVPEYGRFSEAKIV